MTRNRGMRIRNPLAGVLGGPLVAVIGAGIAWFGWTVRADTLRFVERSQRAEGAVVEVVAQTQTQDGERKTYFYPVIEFVTAGGKTVRFQDPTGSNPPRHRVGDAVRVLYDPLTPEHARVETFTSLWLMPALLLAMGGIFILFGILGFFNSLLWLLGIAGLLGIGAWFLARRNKPPEA